MAPPDYAYEKSHIIIGSPDGALTDYQVKLAVHRGNGTDGGEDVYLNGCSLSWPYDIQFTDSKQNSLNFWIESSDLSTAVIWVKVAAIPASPGTTRIFLDYGKSGEAVSPGNGKGTFDFFDDFNSPGLDTAIWSNLNSATVSQTNGVLDVTTTLVDTSSGVRGNAYYGYGYAMRARTMTDVVGYAAGQWSEVIFDNQSTVQSAAFVYCQPYKSGSEFNNYNGVQYEPKRVAGVPDKLLSNTWYISEIGYTPGRVSYSIDDAFPTVIPYGVPDTMLTPSLVTRKSGTATAPHIYADWAAVRKYTVNEPAHGAWTV